MATATLRRPAQHRRGRTTAPADPRDVLPDVALPVRQDAELSQAATLASAVEDAAGFVALLGRLRAEKDLSYERIGRRARGGLSRNRVHVMLRTPTLPRLWHLELFLKACRVPDVEFAVWLAAYERLRLAPAPEVDASVTVEPDTPAADQVPVAAQTVEPERPWPELVYRPRKVRNPWPRRCASVVGAITALVAPVIALARAGVPAEVTQVLLAILAGCVAVYGNARAAGLREIRRAPYRWVDDATSSVFADAPRVARPVIGE